MKETRPPNEISRSAIWPSVCIIFGLGFLLLSAACVVSVWFGSTALNDADQANDFEALKQSVAFSNLVIPLALIGGVLTVLGLVFRKRGSNDQSRDTVACPTCGRENAVTSRNCPRCETKLE